VAIGSLATAGTLGIMIPPSIIMVVYASRPRSRSCGVHRGDDPGRDRDGAVQPLHRRWALLNPKKQPPPGERLNFVQKLRQSAQLIPASCSSSA
jgi:hypothetical protein